MTDIFVHWGNQRLQEIKPLSWRPSPKPRGGLWASPLNSPRSWWSFCALELHRLYKEDDFFNFRILPEAKILTLDSYKDFKDLPVRPSILGDCSYPDWKKVAESYDGVYMTIDGLKISYETLGNPKLPLTFGWDCESICIFNQKIICQVQ